MSAPGVRIYATMPTYQVTMTREWGFPEEYGHMSGTSMACPNVAGLAALILARYPDLTPEQVREALRNTGDDLGAPGFDPYFGYGRVNAGTAPAELSTSDPNVSFAGASRSTFVSVPRWGTSESVAPVLLAVSAATPVPHYVLFHAVLTDDAGGRWEGDFEVSVGIYGPSLRVAQVIIDDDNAQQSQGNGDGIANAAETIELLVWLRNDGDLAAAGGQARLSTSDPYLTITDNSEEFGTIGAGGSALSGADFDFKVSKNCPDGHPVTLDLSISDNEGRVWTDHIPFTVYLPPPKVRYESSMRLRTRPRPSLPTWTTTATRTSSWRPTTRPITSTRTGGTVPSRTYRSAPPRAMGGIITRERPRRTSTATGTGEPRRPARHGEGGRPAGAGNGVNEPLAAKGNLS